MKSLKIISLLVCLALVVGCKKDETSSESVKENINNVVITMDLQSGRVESRAASMYADKDGVLGSAEYVIDRLRVYVFASNGKLDKMELYDDLNADHLISKTIEVPKDLSKELYFVANEPTAISTQLDGITTIEDLERVDFVIADGMNQALNGGASFSADDFLMPMSTRYSLKNAMSDLKIYVGLKRCLARVDLYLGKGASAASRTVELDATTTLKAHGVTNVSTLFSHDLQKPDIVRDLADVASSDIVLSSSKPQRVLSFYVAERMYDLSKSISIEVDGMLENGVSLDSKSVTLGDAGTLKEINRNTVYRIYGSYNGSEIVADDFEIMDWDDVEIDAEIEGVMVAVDSEVAMDWLRNGNSYASKNISFGSNKPIKFLLPVSVSSGDSPVPDYEFEEFTFADMSAGKSYNLKDIALANNYIYATSWIDEAVIHFTSDRSGYISFTYQPVKVNYKIQNYSIRIKSDNVIKQMSAIYDNGYLPASMLSDAWAKRARGGVVFSKRGEAKHPVTTADILYRDSDGYYRGEHKATAADGTRYCTETFGEGWYMPSYADMIEIASMYDVLGVSYRFQNNGSAEGSGALTESRYWTSSTSESTPGQYWSGDFMSREYMVDDSLMEQRSGSDSYFVRCIMDLK